MLSSVALRPPSRACRDVKHQTQVDGTDAQRAQPVAGEVLCPGRRGARQDDRERRGQSLHDLGGFALHLLLAPEDTAPGLVLGNGHAAFAADSDALGRFGLAGEQFTKKPHDDSWKWFPNETEIGPISFAAPQKTARMTVTGYNRRTQMPLNLEPGATLRQYRISPPRTRGHG